LGTETSQIFGRFVVAIIQSIAQNRIKQPKRFRKKCYLFIDEAQNYISPSIDIILKEARKFGVYLVLANQNVTDIEPSRLLQSLLNNTDIKVI
jgi:type IV secretory pathway VirB4 component